MNLNAFALRVRWLQMPTGLLILLLQRTPLLRVAAQFEVLLSENAPAILRSVFAVAAMGSYNSLAGATTFNVTATPVAATPTSGAANAKFTVPGTTGSAMSVGISVSGAPGNPKSWSVAGALPAGISVTGGNPVNVVAPYKMTIAGTPTASGSFPVTVTAWDGSNGTGGNSAKITVTFAIASGVVNVAPSFTTQPASLTVTAGGSASLTVAASGTPAPTYQWQKGGVNIAGATNATYTVGSAAAGDTGSYTVVATNSAGSATSAAATLTVNAGATAPSITTQPVSLTVTAGTPASLTVAAGGNPAPTFQWQKGGVNIAGATNATYSIGSAAAGDVGSYTVVATNSAGSVTSAAATLTVNPPATAPAITTQPASVTVIAGGSASFTVAASGNPAPTYQWQKGGANIAGATSATYAIGSTTSGDAGNYTVVASNSAGNVTSAAATLTVNPAPAAPTIINQPANQSATVGGSATFAVTASGNPAPTYQWQKSGANIAGATNATLALGNVQNADAGNYAVVVSNSSGSVTSSTASLTVTATSTAPAITTQPASQTVTTGTSVSFTVAASGSPSPTYQWQKGAVNIAGATGATYTIASAATGDAGNYTVVATNSAGSATSAVATLTVNLALTAPVFTTQPASVSLTAGGSASFSVVANGNPAPTYQWQKGGANIAGATGATYAIASVVAGDAGNYTAVATNSVGSVTSSVATLTVQTVSTATAPAITTNPSSQTVSVGAAVSFSVAASGSPAPTFQWYFGGAAISSATGTTLALANVQAGDAGDYYATASNSAGSAISSTAHLTVQAQVSLASAASQIVTAGHDVALAVAGAGGGMQWQASTDGGTTWTNLTDGPTYSGATSATLEILGASSALNGNKYRCVPTSGGASYASAVTTLTVAPAYFPFPTSVGADGSGSLYVGDASAQTIQKISTSGQVTLVAGSAGQAGSADGAGGSARFNQPGGLAVGADGTLSVSDTANDSVRGITAAGGVTTVAGSPGSHGTIDGTGTAAKFWSPIGIARDASGTVFVADSLNHVVRKITTGGTVSTLAGSAGVAGAADGTGASAQFNHPTGLAVDGSGNVYVADAANNTIRKITSGGTVSTLAGLAGASGTQDGTGTGARFNNPGGLTVDGAGDLYLADTGNSTIRKISAAGMVSTIAGLPGIPGLMDGAGSYAWFDRPEGVSLNVDGNLYVADSGNAAIRKVTLGGAVTTLALSPGSSSSSSGSAGGSSGSSGSTGSTGSTGGTGSPASAPSSAGAGGGAIDGWLASGLGLAWLIRWRQRKTVPSNLHSRG